MAINHRRPFLFFKITMSSGIWREKNCNEKAASAGSDRHYNSSQQSKRLLYNDKLLGTL